MTGNPEIGKSVEVNGLRTNYLEAGSTDSPPLLLIHGSGPGVTAYANWNGVIADLAREHRVVAPDMVGFGYTQPPADIAAFRKADWVSHLVAFMGALGIGRADIIGNSFGGALALGIAERSPERVGRLVLMGAVSVPFPISAGLDAVWSFRPTREAMRELMHIFAYDPNLVTDPIVESRLQASLRPETRAQYEALFQAPLQERLDDLSFPEDVLAGIAHPALIIHGREDQVIPLETSIRLSQLLADSELHVFGRCGHWTQIERRTRFVDVVTGFLRA